MDIQITFVDTAILILQIIRVITTFGLGVALTGIIVNLLTKKMPGTDRAAVTMSGVFVLLAIVLIWM